MRPLKKHLPNLMALAFFALSSGCRVDAENKPWPPRVGQAYPDLQLVDANNKPVRLSSFKGKVLVIEPIGMNCPACLAWSGAHLVGAFEGASPQPNVTDIETMFPRYAGGVRLDDARITYIQLLLFNMQMQAATADDAKRWEAHFYKGKTKKPIVLAGGPWFLQPAQHPASYGLIPGFQLIDKNFVLRSDATGDNPKTNMWKELLPMVPKVLEEAGH